MTAVVNEQLVHDVELVSAVWSGKLDVRLDDPYHFDHPLDHIPGMALLGGLLEFVRCSGAAELACPGRRAVFSAEFPSFCELDGAVVLQAARLPTGVPGVETALSLLAEQGPRVVCDAELTVRPRRAGAGGDRWGGTHWLPADPASVHRQHQENVFITGMAGRGDTRVVALRPAPAGHALASEPGEPHRIELLVDAVRQFCIMVCHLEHDRPMDTKLVLTGVSADLPCGLDSAVHLRWAVTPPGRGALSFAADVVAGDPDGEPCGSVEIRYRAATPTAYRRLRGAAPEAL